MTTDSRSSRLEDLSPRALQTLIERLAGSASGLDRPISPRGEAGPPPLSFAQERLWFLDRLDPGTAAYNMPLVVELRGRLRPAALAGALSDLAARHEVLRAAFPRAGGLPRQEISPPAAVPLPVVDLSRLAPRRSAAVAQGLAARHAARPFDLERGPLLAAALVRLDPSRHRALLVVHHIACDGWSVGVFTREIGALYESRAAGRPAALPPLPIQYGDYAAWQRGAVDQRGVERWAERLAEAPPPPALPADGAGARTAGFRGGRLERALPQELCRRLRALGREEEASVAMVLLAAVAVLLARLSGRDDVVVGAPIAGRDRPETEGLIGCFLNMLVLRLELSGQPTFRAALRRVRDTNLEAYADREVPIEAVLQRLPGGHDPVRAPLFRVLFNVLNFPRAEIELPGLEVEVLSGLEVPSKFDLTFYVSEEAEGLRVVLVYNAELFVEERMTGLLEQLELLAAAGTARPDAPVGEASLITSRARERLPDPGAELPATWPGSVPERFRRHAVEAPDRLAAVDPFGSWSYGALAGAAESVRTRLTAAGVGPERVVAIYGHRSAPLLAALLGTLEAGAAFLVLDPAHPAPRLAEALVAAPVRAWIQIAAAGEPPPEVRAAVEAAAPACRLRLGACPSRPPGRPAAGPHPAHPQALAYVATTSGSTGRARAVAGPHRPLAHFLDWHVERSGLGPDDRFAAVSGLSHDPLLRDLFGALWAGAPVVFPETSVFDAPGALRRWLARSGATVVHLTPAHGRLLEVGEGRSLDALRHAFFGGEVLTIEAVRRFRRIAPVAAIVSYYGATETPQGRGWCLVAEAGHDPVGAPAEAVPLGRGIDGVQLLVLDRRGFPTGVGELGEVCVRTPYQARGYLGAAATAERFVPDPGPPRGGRLYRTGDLGRYLPDGRVVFAGRADRQVKVRGVRVELEEVESALAAHPDVAEAAVAAVTEDPGAATLAAWVAPRDGREPGPAELREHLRSRLPEPAVPGTVVVVDRLPRTPNGKLDRRALQALSPAPAPAAAPAPPGPLEEPLAALWAELFGRRDLPRDADFFALGGHSLLAVRLLGRIEETFRVELPLRDLFAAPTLGRLAARIEEARQRERGEASGGRRLPPPPPLTPAPAGEEAPLSFAQERFWILDRLRPGRADYHLPMAVRLRGPLSPGLLARSLAGVLARHQVLRTTFPTVDHRPVQRVAPSPDVRLPVADLGALPPAAREGEAARLARHAVRRPLDPSRGPLVRALLARLAAEDHVAVLVLHHLVTDGWSTGLLVGELGAIYRSLEEGSPAALPELPVQYRDYAAWYRGWLQGEALAARLDYWRKALAGAPREVALPREVPSPGDGARRGAEVTEVLEAELVESLKDLARRRGATLFAVLMAAFQALLWRWTGQEDLVVGTVSAGRDRPELEPLIGPMLDFLPVRARIPAGGTFEALLAGVQERMLEAHRHRHCPFEHIVRATGAAGAPGSNPLYNVALLLQNLPPVPAFSDRLAAAPVPVSTGAELLDLRLVAEELREGLRLRFEYAAGRLREDTVRAAAVAYRSLLKDIAADPGAELARLPAPAAAGPGETAAEPLVAVAATFTAEPVVRSLRFWLEEIGLPARVELAPYAQVFQQLLDPEGLLGSNRRGVNVVLVRLEDWGRHREGRTGSGWAELERDAGDLGRAVRSFAGRSSTPLVLVVCPSALPVVEDPLAAGALERAERTLSADLAGVPGVHVVESGELGALYPVAQVFDRRGDALGHLPYSQATFAALGTLVARRAFALLHPPYKVVALDCDHTLWQGICGEVGPGGVVVDAPRRELQELMLTLRDRGMLLVLCSKNNPEDVEAVFRDGPAMPLAWDDFTARRIDWSPKSEGLRSIAAELGLGLDSFVFLDDSPLECAEVQASCPEVLSLRLPEDPLEIPVFLRHVWAFDRLEVTEEDRRRAELYRESGARERLREESASLEDFLENLELEVEVDALTPDRLPRAAQLTQRTNQFNTTTVRRTEGELRALVDAGALEARVVHVRDRFGDYGLVGLVLFAERGAALEVETFLLSCRVLGRRVEHRVVEELSRLAVERGLDGIALRFRPTGRNRPALEFLESIAGADAADHGDGVAYRVPVGCPGSAAGAGLAGVAVAGGGAGG